MLQNTIRDTTTKIPTYVFFYPVSVNFSKTLVIQHNALSSLHYIFLQYMMFLVHNSYVNLRNKLNETWQPSHRINNQDNDVRI
jgi:hypothetical protein